MPTSQSEEYDYVIVGGGSAGCVLAYRLGQDASRTVLVLEAGGPYPSNMNCPLLSVRRMNAKKDAVLRRELTAKVPGLDGRQVDSITARVAGGGSSCNAMIYNRGHSKAYNLWKQQGNGSWGFADLLPYFKKSENFSGGASEFHGASGPYHVTEHQVNIPFCDAFIEACVKAGIRRNTDFNGAEQEGAGYYQLSQHRGRRSSCAVDFLEPAARRSNVQVRTRTIATRVVIENSNAVGVEYLVEKKKLLVRARREVILSAGAVGSPHLLMLSGVGPAEQLRRFGIKVELELAGVGMNLQDHFRVPVVYRSKGRQPLSVSGSIVAAAQYLFQKRGVLTCNNCDAGAMVKVRSSAPFPDLQFVLHWRTGRGADTVDFEPCLAGPVSRGSLSLQSSDPLVYPLVQPGYLSDPADYEPVVHGVHLARELASSAVFREFGLAEEILPGHDVRGADGVRAHIRKYATTCFHTTGTCKMGTDGLAVVDDKLRVRGLGGLRVIDASVMPLIPPGNTNAAAMMLGEIGADLLARHPA